jgi:hypothetical protein
LLTWLLISIAAAESFGKQIYKILGFSQEKCFYIKNKQSELFVFDV